MHIFIRGLKVDYAATSTTNLTNNCWMIDDRSFYTTYSAPITAAGTALTPN